MPTGTHEPDAYATLLEVLLALRIITENDGLVSDSRSIQCFHESLLIGGLRTSYLYADGAI